MGRRRSSDGGLGLALFVIALVVLPALKFIGENPGAAFAIVAGLAGVYCLLKATVWKSKAAQHADPDLQVSTPLSTRGEDFWIPAGRTTELNGSPIGPLVYVGRGLSDINQSGTPEPALIDPQLPIARAIDDCTVRRLSYWPSYSGATPGARAAYLLWLRTGRSHPKADIGYVFLYFYGLERRALHDALQSDAAKSEIPAIEREVERLLGIYGENRSFERYAGRFLDFLRARSIPPARYREAPPARTGQALGFSDRLALAQCAADGAQLPAAWAHYWICSHGAAPLNAVPRRCPSEFETLFGIKYRNAFGEGLTLPHNRTLLKLEYQPASVSFSKGGSASISNARSTSRRADPLTIDTSLPDVSVLTSPLKKLETLALEACAELEGYGRRIAKDSSASESLEALSALPLAVWPAQYRDRLESLRDVVQRTDQPAAIPLEKFRSWLPGLAELTRPRLRALSEALAKAGLGIEPDVRFGGSVPAATSRLILFTEPAADASEKPSSGYAAAALTLHLASAVAAADGEVAELEHSLLTWHLQEVLHLTPSERRRLHARIRLMLIEPPKLTGLKGRLEALAPAARSTIGEFLVAVAQVDAVMTPEEVRSLQKIFRLLGLDPETVYSKLHVAATMTAAPPPATEPVSVNRRSGTVPLPMTAASQDPRAAGYAVPPPATVPPSAPPQSNAKPARAPGIVLDPAKVEALQKDTERVARLLAAVFDTPLPDPEEPDGHTLAESNADEPKQEPGLLGLDPVHSSLLETLISRTHWTRTELEELATDRDLMLDGALEVINEASFEKLAMPLIEDGEPVSMNLDAVREIIGEHSREAEYQAA